MSYNLVAGAVYKKCKQLPNVIPCHTLPDIRNDAIIIGVCGVNLEDKEDFCNDSWFLSDFCAFNYLAHGLGSRQTWMTTVSESSLLNFIDANKELLPGLLHGNPVKDRQIVFSKELVEKRELTSFTVHKPSLLIPSFLKEVKEAVELSKKSNPPRPVMLFIFGHGTSDLGVHLDYSANTENSHELLYFRDIEAALESNTPATVITTSCYSGGWAIRPNTNMTILTAAGALGHDPEYNELSKSWPVSDSVSRACGSIFADTLIASLTSSTTPLLEGAETSSSSQASTALQPINPSPLQTATYNAFCKTIMRILEEDMTRMPEIHTFRFAAQDDEWTKCWMGRTGVPLSRFEQRWAKLPIYPCNQQNRPANLDPRNVVELAGTIAALSVNTKDAEMRIGSLMRSLSSRMMYPSLRLAARKHINACPGDWDAGANKMIRGAFRRFAEGKEAGWKMTEELAISTLLYRDQLTTYIDLVVKYYNLQKAQGKTLLYWERNLHRSYYGLDSNKVDKVEAEMNSQGLEWPAIEPQYHGFSRATTYLAECIALTPLSLSDVRTLIRSIKDGYTQKEHLSKEKVMRNESFRSQASTWFKSIGKRSLLDSPVKKGSK